MFKNKAWLLKSLSAVLFGALALPCAAQTTRPVSPKPMPNPAPNPSPTPAPPIYQPSNYNNGDLRSYIIANRYNSYFNGTGMNSGRNSLIASSISSPFINQMQQGMLPGGMYADPWQSSNPYMTPFMNPMIPNNPLMNPMMSNPFMNPMMSNPFMNPMMGNPFMNPMMSNPFMNPMMNQMPMTLFSGYPTSPFAMQPGMFGQMNNPFGQGGGMMMTQPGLFGRGF